MNAGILVVLLTFVKMSLPLRITFEQQDYTYTVLTKGIDKNTKEIKINLSGQDYTLVRNQQNQWHAQEATIGDNLALLHEVGRMVALRYRL